VAVDLRSLAALRIGLALVLLGDLASRAADLSAHYTDAGIMPRAEVLRWLGPAAHVSVHMLGGGASFEAALFVVAALAAGALLLGWRTRLATILCWYLALSVQVRDPAVVHGGDNLLRVLLFWSMFLPLGGRWSLDRRRRDPTPGQVTSVWGLALRLQLCFVYWFTAALKWYPPWLGERSAVGLAMTDDRFTTAWGQVLKGHPDLLAALTPAVMALEILGPLAVWSPFKPAQVRVAVVTLFVGFHLIGLAPAMVLGTFPWVAAVAWTVFLPSWFWERLAEHPWGRRRRESGGARVDAGSKERRGSPAGATPGLAEGAGVTVGVAPDLGDGNGATAGTGPDLGDGSGATAGAGSDLGAAAPQDLLARVLTPPLRRRLSDAAAGLLLAYVLGLNLLNVVHDRLGLPPPAASAPAFYVGLHQSWRMFTPAPDTHDGWFEMVGKLADGRKWEIWRDRPPDPRKPPLVSASLGDNRWVKYLSQFTDPDRRGFLPLFCRYLCRRWNAEHGGADRATAVRIVFILEETLAPGREAPPRPFVLWQARCPEARAPAP
jgi:HTTM domain